MKNKTSFLISLILLIANTAYSQDAGNLIYQNPEQFRLPDNNINIQWTNSGDLLFSIKGLSNVEADSYVAIFSLSQIGKTTEEVNQLIDERIDLVKNAIKGKPNVQLYLDMISFVPMYEYEVEKKIFSKKTYNEVPIGFELKKNLHIQYQDPALLNELIAVCAKAEIYDIVRVDYFSDNLVDKKKELMTQAQSLIKEKVEHYELLLGEELDTLRKEVVDGFKVLYPVESYKSYQVYNSSSLNLKKPANVNNADKSRTLYYQPVIDKEFDFVINPVIIEPVIQVMYEIKLMIRRPIKKVVPKAKPQETQYMLITPNGDVKNLNIGN